MNRLTLFEKEKSLNTVNALYDEMSRRLEFSPQGNCPVELTSAFLKLCLAQSCGKCVPCRVGLDNLMELLEKVLDKKATAEDLMIIERTAAVIADSADCAIGYAAANLVLQGFAAFKNDYISHMNTGRCTAEFASVPCVDGCPAHVDIPGYVALVKEGRYADAIRLIRKDNPFPSTCALICEHPCEHHCRRGLVDAPVNIRGLKRVAVDKAGDVPPPEITARKSGKTIAVVGAGPAGLTAAYYLALMGHSVTVYEKRARTGGMLRYGIPCYRLPDEYLDRDIDAILSLGVKLHLGVDIGSDITLAELRKQFDAVYISIGAHADKKLRIPGEDSRGVFSAVQLLRAIGDGQAPDFTGKNVVIIGGGNVAMDVTRTSRRLGARSVTCAYRRRIEDMTALREEIDGAAAESCEIMPLMAPVRVEADENGDVTGIVLQPQVIGAYNRGRPAPYKADKPEVTLPCDVIIVAIGQAIESAHFAESGAPLRWDQLQTRPGTSVEGLRGVFAGGDCVSGPATVIRAIDAGKVAAANIDEFLDCHTDISAGVDIPIPSYKFQSRCGRVNMAERPAEERAGDFILMEHGMSDEEAAQEASRCLRCDHYGKGCFKGGRQSKW
ncbi:MAG: FAD-dependent oxidoreductase [Christensenellaceae bacterium]|nr:FAD-dependent oxidoreductase [Christensenellaceae bacterium]